MITIVITANKVVLWGGFSSCKSIAGLKSHRRAVIASLMYLTHYQKRTQKCGDACIDINFTLLRNKDLQIYFVTKKLTSISLAPNQPRLVDGNLNYTPIRRFMRIRTCDLLISTCYYVMFVLLLLMFSLCISLVLMMTVLSKDVSMFYFWEYSLLHRLWELQKFRDLPLYIGFET